MAPKFVRQIITEAGFDIAIDPGTHGADCADIIHEFGNAAGTLVSDKWMPEANCKGDCVGCECRYRARMAELRPA